MFDSVIVPFHEAYILTGQRTPGLKDVAEAKFPQQNIICVKVIPSENMIQNIGI